uniref:Carboxylesterase type B domain-containing protein n=1 Tax=Megaselia scalaris TaxID=36166 RepID=T1H2V9_MEGSC
MNHQNFTDSPKPFPPWKGIRSAKKDGSKCTKCYGSKPDDPTEGSEDCLFLNVYTPPLKRISKHGLPVIVWIHGGSWLGGSNDHKIYGPDFLLN